MTAPFPDYINPLTGWRVWSVKADGALRGLNGQLWYGFDANKAYCTSGSALAHKDYSPDLTCTCGIWSFKTFPLLMNNDVGGYVRPGSRQSRNTGVHSYVLGTINLWGRTVEHEYGYRSQFAYPKGIILAPSTGAQALATRIRKRYGCEVEVSSLLRDWEEMVEDEARKRLENS